MSELLPDRSRKILQNKVVDGGQADNQHQIILPQNTNTNLQNIVREKAALYYDTTANAVVIDNGTTLVALGGSVPVSSVTATAPLISSGGTTPNISESQATNTTDGYLSSTDWNTFNSKQSAGTYITALSGDVVATGPGSSNTVIQSNVVTNSKLAQMPADTIKGNNTASLANASDLTGSQVTALLSPFVGDSGTGGIQGVVPAPPALSTYAGDFLSANGTWQYVDQRNIIQPSFSLLNQTLQPIVPGYTHTVAAYQNVVIQGNYAYVVGTGGDSTGIIGLTLSIFNIANPNAPFLESYITTGSVRWTTGASFLNGSYNLAVSGNYAYIASSGSVYLYIVNIQNPAAPYNVSYITAPIATGSIYGVVYQNGYCYLATQNTGLVVVDVGGGAGGGTITAPVVTYQEGGSVKSFGVVVSGTNLYTTQYVTTAGYATRQIKSWTLSGLGTVIVPSLVQSLQVTTAGEALAISLSGNTAFVTVVATGVNSVDLIDITTPSAMTNLSQIAAPNTMSGAMSAQANGNIIYIPSGSNATYGGAIDAYDISNRSLPIHIAQATTKVPNSVFGGIKLANGYIYAADYGTSPSYSATLDIFTQLSNTLDFGTAIGSSLTLNTLNLITAQTIYHGSISGTAVWSMPFQGSSYKKFIIDLLALSDAGGTITFPTAFIQIPWVYGNAASVAVASANTTTLTLSPTSSVSGLIFIEGY